MPNQVIFFFFLILVVPGCIHAPRGKNEEINNNEKYINALQYIGKKEYKEATAILKNIISRDYQFYKAYRTLVDIYNITDELDLLVPYFIELSKKNNNSCAFWAIGLIFSKKNMYGEALTNYKTAIARDNQFTSLYQELVNAYIGTGSDRKAAAARVEDYLNNLARSQPDNAYIYYGLGFLQYVMNKKEAALSMFTKVIAIDPAIAQAHLMSGLIYYSAEKYDMALEHFNEALHLYSRDRDIAGECKIFINIGNIYFQEANYPFALEYYNKALPVYQEIGDTLGECITLDNIGIVYLNLPDYPGALLVFKKALKLYGETGYEKEKCQTLYHIGNAYLYLSEYTSALEYFDKALAINNTLGDMAMECNIITNLGSVSSYLSNYPEALAYFNKALFISRITYNRISEGIIIGNIGNVYIQMADYNKALEYYEQALAIAREVDDKKSETAMLNYFGVVYQELSDYPRALEYYEYALATARETGNPAGEREIFINIGNLYNRLSDYSRALTCYENALTICREIGDIKGEGTNLGNIGSVYYNLTDYTKALEYCEKALAIYKEIGSKNQQSTILNNIGIIYQELSDYPIAFEKIKKALAIARETGNPAVEGICLNNMGEIHEKLSEYSSALFYYTETLTIFRETGYKEGEGLVLGAIGNICFLIKEYPEALRHLEEAVRVIESIRSTFKHEQFKMGFLREKIEIYEHMINLLYEMHRENPAERYADTAFIYAEKSKARGLLDLLTESRADIRQGVDPGLLNREQQNEKDYFRTYKKLQEEQTKPAALVDKGKVSELKKELLALEEQYEQIKLRLTRENPRYAELKYPGPVTVSRVREILIDQQTILVEYKVTEDALFAWRITSSDTRFYKLPVAREELRNKVLAMRNLFTAEILFEEEFFSERADDLYLTLLEPVLAGIEGKDNLLIIPDGILYYLPFEILLKNPPHADYSGLKYDELPFLIKDYAVHYSQSSSVACYTLQAGKESRNPATRDFFALGDPVFPEGENGAVNGLPGSTFSEPGRSGLKRLIHSGDEVRNIGSLFSEPDIYVREQAREEVVKPPNRLDVYRYIHLATHGFFDEKNPHFSGIVFTQDDDPAEDGYLLVNEIFNLKLQADLVVLSACETGLGQSIEGEGLVGLTRAWMYAGTPALVVSLWEVDDESTRYLMEEFYKNIRGNTDFHTALRNAKLKLMKMTGSNEAGENTHQSYGNPYYWAGFILMGNR